MALKSFAHSQFLCFRVVQLWLQPCVVQVCASRFCCSCAEPSSLEKCKDFSQLLFIMGVIHLSEQNLVKQNPAHNFRSSSVSANSVHCSTVFILASKFYVCMVTKMALQRSQHDGMGILYENSSRIAFSFLFAITFDAFGLVLVKCRQGDENDPLVTLGVW